MTKNKRFNSVGGYVYDGDKCISHFEDVTHRDDIVTLLNELHEEKERLQYFESLYRERNLQLEKENKELKKKLESKQRLINAYDNYIKTLKEDGVLDD